MDNSYEYALHPSRKIIFRAKSILNGTNEMVFYKGIEGWKENDDYGLTGNVEWIVSEEEALQAALDLGMSEEKFYE